MSAGDASILPLEFDAVTYAVGATQLLKRVSTRLEAGRRSVILGPNGAGKSLMLRIAHGLLVPSAGSVRWRGVTRQAAGARCALVFERPVLLRRSAVGNVEFALALRGVPRPERRDRALHALEWTGLAALAARPARVLSAGEKQRLSLARAWAVQPEVLFLDEPTAALDPGAARKIEELILAFAAKGAKIVMTTHDMAQARRLGEEVLFMHQGELVEQSPVERFFEQPASDVARAFVKGELIG